jgi:hypothetical protein
MPETAIRPGDASDTTDGSSGVALASRGLLIRIKARWILRTNIREGERRR